MGRVEQNYLGLGRQVRNSDTLLPRGYKCLVFSYTLAVARCYFKIQNWCISDNQRLCWSSWGHTSSMIWSSYLSLPINASLSLSLLYKLFPLHSFSPVTFSPLYIHFPLGLNLPAPEQHTQCHWKPLLTRAGGLSARHILTSIIAEPRLLTQVEFNPRKHFKQLQRCDNSTLCLH